MAGSQKSLQKFVRRINEANAALGQRWTAVSNHLRLGLAQPVATSAILRKVYKAPSDFPRADGKMHHKPMRALYGLGADAKAHFDYDLALYGRYCVWLKSQVDAANSAVEFWVGKAQAGDGIAVRWYCKTVLPYVLSAIPGSDDYLVSGYSARERYLVVERYVPDLEVIPEVRRYDIGRNLSLQTSQVTDRDRSWLYLSFIGQVALLTLDRIFRTEITNVIATATVNCMTVIRNPATGHLEAICVVSVSVTQERFVGLNLLGVDPATCIYSLNGRLTSSPGNYAPVVPWAEAEAQGDVVITVGNTPLLEMDPAQFEQLVTELLRRMGLRAQTTGRAGDGGVDCEAYDDRPVVGGRVIVQVKRYASTVSPSVVRDLFGTVHATGATKGVLITTSGFGPESREFVQGKPLELIDGVKLDVLLRQYQLSGIVPAQQRVAPPTFD
jgi:restriction system protein